MSMEFLILQGNTQSISTINYKIAATQMERREVQDQITQVTEMMQEYEDSADYIITGQKTEAKNEYDLSIKNYQNDTSTALKTQNDAKAALDEATSTVNTLEQQVADIESGKIQAPADKSLDQLKKDLQRAKEIERQAKTVYTNASNTYSAKVEENRQNQQIAYSNYQSKLESIEAMKKSMKDVYNTAKKSQLNELNKQDQRLELSLNDLNQMKEMLKSEKDSAKESAEQKAQDLAPKYG
ncbi:hypothetical protein IJ732_06670 [bacterium]|nr:hypothetical protein [bacterium]